MLDEQVLGELRRRMAGLQSGLCEGDLSVSFAGDGILISLRLEPCDRAKIYSLVDRFLHEYLVQKQRVAV